MSRVLTGIQSSGRPHLGNILGALKPAINLANQLEHEALFFIADLHSLTTIKDAMVLKENTYAVAAAWLAFGFDTDKHIFYRQSDVTEVCELAWILSCLTPFPMLANAHSFKDKSGRLSDVNAGLFTYPVLMAADIIIYNADVVPVGKDQVQHLEMARDIASAFNNTYGETFVLPNARVDEQLMTIPGTDGQKMSKSYNNYIDIFLPEKQLKKVVMSIVTDSKGMEEPKDPDSNIIFKIFSLIAPDNQVEAMRTSMQRGNYGYGHAKQELLGSILDNYKKEREIYNFYMENISEIDNRLKTGAEKAKKIAREVLSRARQNIGFSGIV